MIGYVTLGTNDLARAAQCYDALAAEMNTPRMMETETYIAWAVPGGPAGVAITSPYDGQTATVGNGVMVALEARDRAQVERMHGVEFRESRRERQRWVEGRVAAGQGSHLPWAVPVHDESSASNGGEAGLGGHRFARDAQFGRGGTDPGAAPALREQSTDVQVECDQGPEWILIRAGHPEGGM